MEFGAVAVRVEVSWKMKTTRMKEVGFKKENHSIRDRNVGQHEVYAIHTATSRLALENRQAGIGVAGDMKQLRNHQNQPPSYSD